MSIDDVSDADTFGGLIHPSGLLCGFCSCSRGFPSSFLSHGALPSRACFVPAPRTLTLAGQTLMGLAHQPYSRRLLCSSGLSYRIITVPCGPSPQFAYRHRSYRDAAANERMMRAISPLSRTEVPLRNSPFQLPNGPRELPFLLKHLLTTGGEKALWCYCSMLFGFLTSMP